ncbi:MAG: type II secretion system protein M [Gammaproteobacteria bacterium]|nr:type II secretion system protein M [Gammaproteobacteria bacterium]
MKEWWLNLSSREKQTTAIGAILVILFLVYALIWSPLANSVETLRERIHHNQALLSWMQQSDKKIDALEKNQEITTRTPNSSLLNIVQTEINKTPFASNIVQLQQAENESIDLRLQKVSFDSLIKWLTAICRKEQLLITQLAITPGATPGIVDAEIKLQLDTHS